MTSSLMPLGWTSKTQDVADANEMAAADRVAFQLTYRRATTTREMTGGELTGDVIDDALRPGVQAPGGWLCDIPNAVTVTEWLDHFAHMAVGEAVHEALEWFHVDGAPWLNPHDPDVEFAIYQLVADFTRRLAVLRVRQQAQLDHDDWLYVHKGVLAAPEQERSS